MDAANAYATPARALLPTCLAILIACGAPSEHPGRNAVARDSAGITIVESSSARWTADRAWRVSAEPLLDIGGETNDIDYLFERIVGVVQLPGSRTAVADGGVNQLRLYDSLGVLERVAGGAGRGPGEFRGLVELFSYPDDSLLAYDHINRRYSVFDAELTFARSFTVVLTNVPAAWPTAVFSDGTLLLRTYDMTEATLSIVGPYRQAEILYRYDPRLDSLVEVARPPGQEMIAIAAPGSAWGDRLPRPFGNESAAGAFADGFFTANSDTYEVRFFDRSRRLTQILRRLDYDDILSRGDEQVARSYFDSAWGPPQHELSHAPNWLRVIQEMEFPRSQPAFGAYFHPRSPAILIDSERDVWVLRYLPPGENAQHWDVFDPTGVWLGTVDFPERFTPIDIGARRVAGLWRDVDRVNHLRVYALEKAGAR